MQADKYYGPVAARYDEDRRRSRRWAREQQAVQNFVFSGPLLDVPVGTGRYLEIYHKKGIPFVGLDLSQDMLAQARKKYPGADLRQGSIFNLPFPAGAFDTAVCTRLFDWLYPDQLAHAIAELRRVARVLVVSIRYGEEGEGRVNYTHDLDKFLGLVKGLLVEGRMLTETTDSGTEEIFRLSRVQWSDVLEQFKYHGANQLEEIQRLTNEWTKLFGLRRVRLTERTPVHAEYWTSDELRAVINYMAAFVPQYVTDEPPRFDPKAPATLIRLGKQVVVLDGRRRINLWQNTPGRYPVFVINGQRQ